MAELTLQHQLTERFRALDDRKISAPIEIAVGDYSFYPYHGFSDILSREDFKKLSQPQLRMLTKIADDILAMQRPELFEAFVNDDGVIVVDKQQPHVEYSIDIEYNAARSRITEIYPQVSYPITLKTKRVQDAFMRNDTAHEVAHHADFWVDQEAVERHLFYLHSSSTLLAWIEELDRILHPQGVAHLIEQVREAEGYSAATLLEESYHPDKVDQMLRAEFFAIATEYYYGSQQTFAEKSPLLKAYMINIVDTDLDIQNLYIPFTEMEKRRKILREAIHAPVERILREHAVTYHMLRARMEEQRNSEADKERFSEQIEELVITAMQELVDGVRKRAKLPAREA